MYGFLNNVSCGYVAGPLFNLQNEARGDILSVKNLNAARLVWYKCTVILFAGESGLCLAGFLTHGRS